MVPHTSAQKLILWVIWVSLFSSIFVYRIFLGGQGVPDDVETSVDAFLLIMLLIPSFGSALMRWVLLPKAKDPQQVLVFAIIGMALGESLVFFGIFLFPAFETSFFVISLLAVFQFIPTYANSSSSSFSGTR